MDQCASVRNDRRPQTRSESAHYRTLQAIARSLPPPPFSSVRRMVEKRIWRRLTASRADSRLMGLQLSRLAPWLRSRRCLKWRFAFSCLQHSNALLDVWQSNRKGQTFALAAFDGEFSAMFSHNATND